MFFSKSNPIFVLLFLANMAAGFSQGTIVKGLTLEENTSIWFDQLIGQANSGIVNGREYQIPFKGFRTNPFFESEPRMATVFYNGYVYAQIPILYDIYNDAIVLCYRSSEGTSFIQLDKEKIESFQLHSQPFKKIAGDFYEVLFSRTDFLLVARRIKTRQVQATVVDYERADRYYLIQNNEWIKLTGKKSFNKTLTRAARKRVKAFVKENRIKKGRVTDSDLSRIVSFYYELKQNNLRR
jgi:hypothetical protein